MKRITKLSLLKMFHFLVSVFGFVFLYFAFYRFHYASIVHLRGDILLCAIYIVIFVLYSRLFGAYEIAYAPLAENVISQSLTAAFSDFVIYFAVSLFYAWMVNPIPMLGLLAVQILWNGLWTTLANRFFYKSFPNRRTVFVYGAEGEIKLERMVKTYAFQKGFSLEKKIKDPESIEQVLKEIEGFDIVIIASVAREIRDAVIKYCNKTDISAVVFPTIEDVLFLGSRSIKTFNELMLGFQKPMPNREYLIIKRAFDILVSFVLLVLLSPLFGIISLLIKKYDGGPVFYRQTRLTIGEKKFEMIKFRSMIIDAEKDGVARLTTQNDSRITPIGLYLRKLRLDELPQLINILKGEMTFVGPRPERPDIAARYEKQIPDFPLRLHVKAGLTGYAQVYGKYNTPPDEKLQMDLLYITHMSIIEDLRILSLTAKVVFLSRSTEGLDEETEGIMPEKMLSNDVM